MKAILSVLLSAALVLPGMAQVPILNSYPQANAVIYLDFDGAYVAGTVWNFSGPITAAPAGLTPGNITEVFSRVAEDFRIFNINVTTDSTLFWSAPIKQRIRIIITPTYEWYGAFGGISYVGSFTWGDNTPAWVCTTLLWNNLKKIAEAASHEAGHTLGLQHQSAYDAGGNLVAEYNPGKGTGQIGWAPIMGDNNSKNITTWFNGPNIFASNYYQDDISIIAGPANGFGLRPDDISDDRTGASPLAMTGYNFQASGLINSASDKDVFRFSVPVATNFKLNAIPENVGVNNAGANIDIRVSLQNAAGNTIGQYNPADLLDAGVDSNLNAGDYYLVVEGVSNVNMSEYGSLGFFLLSGSLYSALPVRDIQLNGELRGNSHQLRWSVKADEPVKSARLQYSYDGEHYNDLNGATTAASGSFTWSPDRPGPVYYRLLVESAKSLIAYSRVVALQAVAPARPVLASRQVYQTIDLRVDQETEYLLVTMNGQVIGRGKLASGMQHIGVNQAPSGLLILQLRQGKETYVEKVIKR